MNDVQARNNDAENDNRSDFIGPLISSELRLRRRIREEIMKFPFPDEMPSVRMLVTQLPPPGSAWEEVDFIHSPISDPSIHFRHQMLKERDPSEIAWVFMDFDAPLSEEPAANLSPSFPKKMSKSKEIKYTYPDGRVNYLQPGSRAYEIATDGRLKPDVLKKHMADVDKRDKELTK